MDPRHKAEDDKTGGATRFSRVACAQRPAACIAIAATHGYNPAISSNRMRRRPAPLEAGQRHFLLENNVMASQLIELKATARPRAGNPAEAIALEYNSLWKQVLKGHFTSTVFELNVDGHKIKVLPRDVQVDPIKDLPLHVDFLRIGSDGVIRVAIPVKFTNEVLSPGLKRGGVLNIVRHDIEVFCPYDRIPANFEVSLEGLEIGRSIHISAVTLPDGVRPVIANRDFTIATVAGAKKEEEVVATPGAEAAAAPVAGDAKAAAPAAGGKAAAPAAGGKAAPAAGGKAPAAGGKAAPAAPAAKKK
jgi:large subunit ribosomal protein L25